jgi:hypothetical protein
MIASRNVHGQEHLHHIYPFPACPVSVDQTSGTCAVLTGMLQNHAKHWKDYRLHMPKVALQLLLND